MGEAKIEIKIGEVSFSGEGNQEWLTEQLDKILDKASELIKLGPALKDHNYNTAGDTTHRPADFSKDKNISSQSLASFLKSKNAATNQVDKFLATAIWVEAKENKDRLRTADISRALSTAKQTKLRNPSETLNQNVSKGFCEKNGKEFFVTQEGKSHMSI